MAAAKRQLAQGHGWQGQGTYQAFIEVQLPKGFPSRHPTRPARPLTRDPVAVANTALISS